MLLRGAGDVLGAFELVDLLRQGGEAVDEDLQLPFQPAQPALHAGVVLLQLRDLLALVGRGQHLGQLLQLGVQLVLLQAHLVEALLHVEAVALQHAHSPVEAVHGQPQQHLEAVLADLWARRVAGRDSRDGPVQARRAQLDPGGGGGVPPGSQRTVHGGGQQVAGRDLQNLNIQGVHRVAGVILVLSETPLPAAVRHNFFLQAEVEHSRAAADRD